MRHPLLTAVTLALALTVTACSTPASEDHLVTGQRMPPAPDSPGVMPLGSYVGVVESPLTPSELSSYLSERMQQPTEEGAFTTGFLFLSELGNAYPERAYNPAEPDESAFASVSLLTSLFTDTCTWCASQREQIYNAATSNARITGGEYEPIADFTGGTLDDGSVVMSVPVERSQITLWAPTGKAFESEPTQELMLSMQLVFDQGVWRVTGVAVDPLESQ